MLEKLKKIILRNKDTSVGNVPQSVDNLLLEDNLFRDITQRHSPEKILNISNEDIQQSINEIGHRPDVKTMEKIERVHGLFLPVVENMITNMLKQTEKNHPNYYAFARDGELLYDALWGIGQAKKNDLLSRVYFLKTSLGMRKNEVHPQYFNEIGLNKKNFKEGLSAVFLDSGYEGSLFYKVVNWAGLNQTIPNKKINGYLVSSVRDFREMNYSGKQDMEQIKNAMKDSPYLEFADGSANDCLCAFMQLMPKFTGRYVKTFKRENGGWDVMPEKFPIASRLKIHSNELCVDSTASSSKSSIEEVCGWVNSDVVDPVASLILQKKTLEYFTDSNTHDRVYSSI